MFEEIENCISSINEKLNYGEIPADFEIGAIAFIGMMNPESNCFDKRLMVGEHAKILEGNIGQGMVWETSSSDLKLFSI